VATRIGPDANALFVESFEGSGAYGRCRVLVSDPIYETSLDLVFDFTITAEDIDEQFTATITATWTNPIDFGVVITTFATAYAGCVGFKSLIAGIKALKKAYSAAKARGGPVTAATVIDCLRDQLSTLRTQVSKSLSDCALDSARKALGF
jgi:hypothetical protein